MSKKVCHQKEKPKNIKRKFQKNKKKGKTKNQKPNKKINRSHQKVHKENKVNDAKVFHER